jgi:GrpB-like predicted nucleotidyltransferase (UPF0157 family)
METLEQRIQRVIHEEIAIAPYDPQWPLLFAREKEHLQSCLPRELIGRIEHFGSTAVPGLAAKPVVDILVEVADLQAARERVAPVLESQGYDYFWRPTHGDNGPPFYAWFIKRDPSTKTRTHHIHMVEPQFEGHWDRLLFRDFLIEHPRSPRNTRDSSSTWRPPTRTTEWHTRRQKPGSSPRSPSEPNSSTDNPLRIPHRAAGDCRAVANKSVRHH